MFKRPNKKHYRSDASECRTEGSRPQETHQPVSSRSRPPNVFSVTPSISAEAGTTGAARRLTPIFLGKANHHDVNKLVYKSCTANTEHRKPEKTATLQMAHVEDEHNHFADILARRMERYICDVDSECAVDSALTERFGEACSQQSSLEMLASNSRKLEAPFSGSAPQPTPNRSHNSSRRDLHVAAPRQANADFLMGSSGSSLLPGPGATSARTIEESVTNHQVHIPPARVDIGARRGSTWVDSSARRDSTYSTSPEENDLQPEATSAPLCQNERLRSIPDRAQSAQPNRRGGMPDSPRNRRWSDGPQQAKSILSPAEAAMKLGEQRSRRGSREKAKPTHFMQHSTRHRYQAPGDESCLEALVSMRSRGEH